MKAEQHIVHLASQYCLNIVLATCHQNTLLCCLLELKGSTDLTVIHIFQEISTEFFTHGYSFLFAKCLILAHLSHLKYCCLTYLGKHFFPPTCAAQISYCAAKKYYC